MIIHICWCNTSIKAHPCLCNGIKPKYFCCFCSFHDNTSCAGATFKHLPDLYTRDQALIENGNLLPLLLYASRVTAAGKFSMPALQGLLDMGVNYGVVFSYCSWVSKEKVGVEFWDVSWEGAFCNLLKFPSLILHRLNCFQMLEGLFQTGNSSLMKLSLFTPQGQWQLVLKVSCSIAGCNSSACGSVSEVNSKLTEGIFCVQTCLCFCSSSLLKPGFTVQIRLYRLMLEPPPKWESPNHLYSDAFPAACRHDLIEHRKNFQESQIYQ